MRYVEGRDLKERLQLGRLDPADAIGILAQVASALDAAHARGLVHRDVKPSNVLLDTGARPDGSDHVYLADFGLTKRVSEEAGIGDDGHLLGTIDYVAPEQIAGEEIDGRADVYSLGCVLYECLVGQPPFRRDSDLAVVFAHLETEPPAPSAERPELPAALDAVIARALAKEPDERYSSCSELARAALAVAVDEASRRLVDVASRAAAGRSDLSEVEAELTGKVIDLQLAREQARALSGPVTPARVAAEGICPFKGLASFEPVDADYFFGRERLVAELVARARRRRLPRHRRPVGQRQVVGPPRRPPPGPRRRRPAGQRELAACCCCDPASGRWTSFAACSFRERRILSPRPSTRCPRARASSSPSTSSRSCSRPAAPTPSVRPSPTRLPARPPIRRVARSSWSRCAPTSTGASPPTRGSPSCWAETRCWSGPCRPRSCGEPSSCPPAGWGCGWSRSWPTRWSTTWRASRARCRCCPPPCSSSGRSGEDNTLTLAAYRESGGVHGAVARLAEGTYARIPDERKQLVRALMLRLVGEDEGDAPVRRRAPLAELDLERNEDVADVLATLADSRLVTVSEGNVEVAHEALLREWPRLREWIEEDTEGRRLRRHITQAATEWDAAGRDQGELYRGARLAAALDWTADHALDVNELEREFVTESREASEQETKRVGARTAACARCSPGSRVLLAAAVAGGIFALVQRGEARDAETAQLAQRLGAQALVEDDLDRSLLLARQAVAIDGSPQTRSYLLEALLRSPKADGIMHGDERVPPRDRGQPRRQDARGWQLTATDFSSSTPGPTRGSAESRR